MKVHIQVYKNLMFMKKNILVNCRFHKRKKKSILPNKPVKKTILIGFYLFE